MRFACVALFSLAVSNVCSAQLLLTNALNRGFEMATLAPWNTIGTQGTRVTATTGFGIVPSQNNAAWAAIYNFGASGAGNYDGVYQTIANVPAGTFILQFDVLAHNRSDSFLWVPGQLSSAPGDSTVRFGYDLTGGTNPNAGSVVLTPPLNTGAQWRRQQVQFSKASTGNVTIFLLSESRNAYAGNWAAFDNGRLDTVTNCAAPITITSCSPSNLNTPPVPGSQMFTIQGANLNQATGATLFGPVSLGGTLDSVTPTQMSITFDLSGALPGTYDLILQHTDTTNCRPGTLSGAFSLTCACPPTVVDTVTNAYGMHGGMHVTRLTGTNLSCLTGVKLRKTRDGGAIINGSLTPVGNDLDVTFDLTNAEGGRYDLLFSHPCQEVTPIAGYPSGFLVYMPSITNGSFEEGWTTDATTGSVCDNPAANGNRPKAKHWDQRLIAASGLGGQKRDGNVWFPACVNGQIKNITGEHYNGIDVVTTGASPANIASFFQTIAAPYVDGNGVSTQAFNVRAEMAINGGAAAYPAVGRIRVYDGTDVSSTTIETTVINSQFEAVDDFGLISDPTYNVVVPAGTIYTSNPPVLTIEFRVNTSANSPSGTAIGFWVDNVRTGPYTAPGCNPVWADSDNDGDVDHDDFGLWQQCFTGTVMGLSGKPAYCNCFDRQPPANTIDEADFVDFKNCRSGPAVAWSLTVAPACVP